MADNLAPTPSTSSDNAEASAFPHPPRARQSHAPTTIENVEHLLRRAGYTARFNVITKQLELRHGSTVVTSTELISLAARYGMNTNLILLFADEIGRRCGYNPVAEWILSKPWDGQDRLKAFCATVTAAPDYPDGLKDILIHRWALSAVAAAVLKSGFHARGVLTLQGDQGLGKTSWIGRLMPSDLAQQFVLLDHHMDGGNKDSILGAIRHWIVEIGELDSSFKKDIARLKGFLTNGFDKIRRPYGRDIQDYPRRTVFAASVNERTFLVDPTGNSRWWTVAVEKLDYQHTIDMQQLYAQLAIEFENGEQWWLTQDEERQLARYNLNHRAISAISEQLRDHLAMEHLDSGLGEYHTASATLALIGYSKPTNAQAKECGTVLRELLGPPKRVQGRERWRIPTRDLVGHHPGVNPAAGRPGDVF